MEEVKEGVKMEAVSLQGKKVKGISRIVIIDTLDDASGELFSLPLLVKLLTSMEFISGFTGSASDFLSKLVKYLNQYLRHYTLQE